MEQSFKQWRDSSRYQFNNESIVISDSDEDVVENSAQEFGEHAFVIDESNDDVDVSKNSTLNKNESDYDDNTPVTQLSKKAIRKVKKKYRIIDSDDSTNENEENDEHEEHHMYNDSYNDPENSHSDEEYLPDNNSDNSSDFENKGKKRKDITHDNTREDIKELKLNSSSESFSNMSFVNDNSHQQSNSVNEVPNVKNEALYDIPVTIELDSDSGSGRNSELELAKSFAKEEIGVGNVDPIVAQKRAVITYKLEQLQNQLAKTKLLLSEGNIEVLPDGGNKLRTRMHEQEKEIEELTMELENTPLIQSFNSQGIKVTEESYLSKKESLFIKDEQSDHENYLNLDVDDMMTRPTTSPELKELGKRAQATRDKELALTVERLQDLHGSLIARPLENEKVEDPRGLKVQLMPHQQHALAWLLWREQQKPAGGVLADDMGLGKTLTMISLIMTTLASKDLRDDSDSDDEWNNERKPLHQKGGTLIVCPASLLSQWENEVRSKCKRGLLSVEIYHGSNRESVPKRLAKNNMVITTYNLLAREYKVNSTLYKIHWKRVILDEAHIVRNHKSKASEAVCGLQATKRWTLTGTPIQNKEMDLYSILKFLKCSPFDDLRVWKRWVDNKNPAGNQRLATVMKTLMLRRTKQELMAKGELESLPDKSIEEIMVKLDPQEQLVYEKILIYSRTLFAQFLAQRADKEHNFDLFHGKYDQPSYLSNPNKETQFTKAQNKLLAMHADVKAHEILVLLLRLRQVCCHPALVHTMLDQEEIQQSGIIETENVDFDLLSQVNNISLNTVDDPKKEETVIDKRIVQNILTAENPVFNNDRISSKMKALLDLVEEILQKNDDKLIIVSQWTILLDVIATHLPSIKGATFSKFNGKVPIKDRQDVVESFNSRNSGPRILLLSLTAGGVGLNLIGGNHLLLFDNHWNPQLETQAQDRIYRFGQTKNVYIYKFICVNTIEERIEAFQNRKLEIARNVLSGDRSKAITKLTLNDLKSLFGF